MERVKVYRMRRRYERNKSTVSSSRPFPIVIFAISLSSRRRANSSGILHEYQLICLTGRQFSAWYNTRCGNRCRPRQLFASQISLRLNSVQTRGDCARRSKSQCPARQWTRRHGQLPYHLLILLHCHNFPGDVVTDPIVAGLFNRAGSALSLLSSLRPTTSGYEIHVAVMTRRKYRWAWITTYPLMPFRLSV